MMRISAIMRIVLALCFAFGLVILATRIDFQARSPTAVASAGSVVLQPPAFARALQTGESEGVDFSIILEEAGVTAYTKLDHELDLEAATSRFKTIAKQTAQFVAGIVVVPGYEERSELEESAEVQVFLHRDGWIVAYLTRWQYASSLFDWIKYEDDRLKSTLLESVVNMFATDEGAIDYAVSHYDFRYPDATNLILAADRADQITRSDSFQITVPRRIVVYEGSWSLAKYGRHNDLHAQCVLDGEQLGRVKAPGREQWGIKVGRLEANSLSVDRQHKVDLALEQQGPGDNERIYCGLAIIYGQ